MNTLKAINNFLQNHTLELAALLFYLAGLYAIVKGGR